MSKKASVKKEELVVNLLDFEFIQDHVLIQAIKVASSAGWAKPKQKDDKPEFGRVISIGDSCGDKLKVGDIVLFGRYVSESTDINGDTFYFVRYEDVKGWSRKFRNGKK